MSIPKNPISGAVLLRKPPVEMDTFLGAVFLMELSLKIDFQRTDV
jgi:hypothetical protein